MSGGKVLDKITMELKDRTTGDLLPVVIDVFDNSLSQKWLRALNQIISENYHLEKNYCFMGFADSDRNGTLILDQVNASIMAINDADIGYQIDDSFALDDCLFPGEVGHAKPGLKINQDRFNWLHRYFEDLQGVSGRISPFYQKADATTRWHIRQLNLLCHEFECWAMSKRKQIYEPVWQRPSQLMCWLHAPRFLLDAEDYELFGIDTINRPQGGVFVGVNKAVGKHHWEVFQDEGRDSRLGELVSSTLRSQTEAAGDFDIEWANNPGDYPWQNEKLNAFREWLTVNGFDPEDPGLTIGHPQVGQVDLQRTFGTMKYQEIWVALNKHLDVYSISTTDHKAVYDYHWSDPDYIDRQVDIIKGH